MWDTTQQSLLWRNHHRTQFFRLTHLNYSITTFRLLKFSYNTNYWRIRPKIFIYPTKRLTFLDGVTYLLVLLKLLFLIAQSPFSSTRFIPRSKRSNYDTDSYHHDGVREFDQSNNFTISSITIIFISSHFTIKDSKVFLL